MPRALSSILLALVLVACASESIGPALAEYDFRYRIQPEGWPIQVFDDGQQTIFQFGEIEPILRVSNEKGPVRGQWRGNYYIVPAIAPVWFVMGQTRRAEVMAIGASPKSPPPVASLWTPASFLALHRGSSLKAELGRYLDSVGWAMDWRGADVIVHTPRVVQAGTLQEALDMAAHPSRLTVTIRPETKIVMVESGFSAPVTRERVIKPVPKVPMKTCLAEMDEGYSVFIASYDNEAQARQTLKRLGKDIQRLRIVAMKAPDHVLATFDLWSGPWVSAQAAAPVQEKLSGRYKNLRVFTPGSLGKTILTYGEAQCLNLD